MRSHELLVCNDLGSSSSVVHSLPHDPGHASQVAVYLCQGLPVADDSPHLHALLASEAVEGMYVTV